MWTRALCARVSEAARNRRSERLLRMRLASLGPATRADLNLCSMADMAALSRNAWREPGQFRSMLEKLNLGGHPWLADPAYLYDLERTCALCPSARRCARWLTLPDCDGYRAFCPNAGEISTMMLDQRSSLGPWSLTEG